MFDHFDEYSRYGMKFGVNELTFMIISKDQLIEVKKLRDLELPFLINSLFKITDFQLMKNLLIY